MPAFLTLCFFSDFVGELGLRMFHLKEFNLLRVLRQLCSCLIRIGAIGEVSGATSCRRAHTRENFGFRHYISVCVCANASEDICSVTSSTCATAREDIFSVTSSTCASARRDICRVA